MVGLCGFLVLLIQAWPSVTDGARILAVFPFQARSHYKVYEPLLARLAERGHAVDAVTHFPQRTKRPNLTDLDVSSSLPSLISSLSLDDIGDFTVWKNIRYLTRYGGWGICEPVLASEPLQRLLRAGPRYDLMIVEIFATDCFLGIAHALRIPVVVGAITSVALPWSNEIVGSPENPSYVPNWFSGYTDRMTFVERILNSALLLATKWSYRILSDWPSRAIATRYLGDDLPSFDELRSRISLILTNGHGAVSTARALAPGLKEIGGIHIPVDGPPPLPKDLRDYLDGADESGVVYFSMGSQVDPATLPGRAFEVLSRAFARLPQKILWKCPTRGMPDLPGNVKCIDWAPQLSILCHPKVRLFVTHGGLLGTQEAVYCAVPILGMPLFGDQYLNVANAMARGMARQLDFRRLDFQQLRDTLDELLGNESYARMARKASERFRDRPIPALEEAVYWVEYVVRRGPDALRTFAAELPWYQYLLLDVVAATSALLVAVLWLLRKFLKLLFGRGERRPVEADKDKKRR